MKQEKPGGPNIGRWLSLTCAHSAFRRGVQLADGQSETKKSGSEAACASHNSGDSREMIPTFRVSTGASARSASTTGAIRGTSDTRGR